MAQSAATPKAAIQPEPKTNNRVATWIKEHDRPFVVIGALILIATFVIKDAIKDHLKDVVNAVTAAQQLYSIRTDIHNIEFELQGEIDQIANHPLSQHELMAKSADLFSSNARSAIDRTSDLVGSLKAAAQESIQTSIDQFNAHYKQFSDELTAFNNNPDAVSGGKLIGTALDLDKKALAIEADVLNKAHQRESEDEHFYGIATWISYVLYVIGWSMAFVGRLVGVDPGIGG